MEDGSSHLIPEENNEELTRLLDQAREIRDRNIFGNPTIVDVMGTPEWDDYIEKTYIFDRTRWN